MKKEIIQSILTDFQISPVPEVIHRTFKIPIHSGKIITLIGTRRCGKTYLFYELIQNLLNNYHIPIENIIYINFEDERFKWTVDELDLILQTITEMFPDKDYKSFYFFFDEIQNIEGWERFIRRIYDTITKNIFITGSNSKLLSKEIATSLRGRTVSFEIFPFSFKEYLAMKNISYQSLSTKTKSSILNAMKEYLSGGGYPETILQTNDLRIKILQEYFNVMLYRDIIERYNLGNVQIFKFFIKRAYSSSSKNFSINAIYKDFKSLGISVGKNQLYELSEMCENVYFYNTIKKHSYSMKKAEIGEKKIYAIDNGILNAIDFKFSNDFGKAMELCVFWELRRQGGEIYFHKDSKECDFINVHSGKEEAVQVCYDMEDKLTREREIAGLIDACKSIKQKKGLIISYEEESELVVDKIKIKIYPLWKWLLGI